MKIICEHIEGIWKTRLEVGPFTTTSTHTDMKRSMISAHEKMLTILFNHKNL